MADKKVVTRFAPSPTGHLHIGGARTAIFSWLLARHFGGDFVLRIEDTDTERSKQEYTDSILASMKWLGLDWNTELVYQSTRAQRYDEVVEQMLADDKAYYCTCTPEEVDAMRAEAEAKGEKPKYNGKCRNLGLKATDNAVVRLKLPDYGKIVLDDMVKGKIVTDINELDDMVIRRPKANGGMAMYNLAVVVDDHDMNITHVLRGDDHVANTPKQILIYEALGWDLPTFGHVPMILGPDGQKLSKRNGAPAVIQYEQDGMLPQTMVNYLVRLGWSSGDNEIFSLKELIEIFDGTSLNASPSRIDPAKLEWLNAHYIKNSSDEELLTSLQALDNVILPQNTPLLLPMFKERANTLIDLAKQMSDFSANILEAENISYDEKAAKSINDENKALLAKLAEKFNSLDSFSTAELDTCIHSFVEENNIKFKNIGPILRCALTGISNGLSLAFIASALGKEKTMQRIEKIIG